MTTQILHWRQLTTKDNNIEYQVNSDEKYYPNVEEVKSKRRLMNLKKMWHNDKTLLSLNM